MEDTKKIINVDLNTQKDRFSQVSKFLFNPLSISLLIIIVIFGGILFIILKNRVPELPQAQAKDAAVGQLNSPKVLVESYEDFECPYCRQFNPVLNSLISDFKNKSVEFVFKQFPLNTIHPYAQTAAEASEYANDHGKFWEYKDKLYEAMDNAFKKQNSEDPTVLSKDYLIQYAKDLGLNGDELKKDLDGHMYKTRVNNEENEGVNRGVQGTPTIYINGKEFATDSSKGIYLDEQSISNAINEQLAK